MRRLFLVLATIVIGFSASSAFAVERDSVYADSVFFGPLGVTSPESALHKPDNVFAHLAGSVDFSVGFKRYAGSVATGALIPIKVGAQIVVTGKPDAAAKRSALAIILVKLTFDGGIEYQSDPFVMEGTEKIVDVATQPYDYVLLTMADSSTSFDVDALLLIEDTTQPNNSVAAAGRVARTGLIANFPNPFSHFTNVSFSMPINGQAALVAVDMQGTEIAREDLGYLAEGTQRVGFELRDRGMYYLRLFVDGRPVGNPIKVVSE
jgi:hypothetical protein